MTRAYQIKNLNTQNGVSLVIALVFLLVITALAISNMREISLEAKITGNMIENKQLLTVAESALRDGERRTTERGPQEPSDNCENIATKKLCLLNREPEYAVDKSNVQVYSPNDGTTLFGAAQWYAQPAPSGSSQGETENPEYGNMILGIGIFRYEVNGIATNNDLSSAIRSTVAIDSKGRIESN
ncbi:pilus assembly protein PilX [Pseudomonas sp. PDM14]|uniref:pilus assembly PilX family protein n=1 Tax=Pseudomonas sp. PDM14 TaxID=2769288 RepID=UPI00177FC9E3|nr:PilX N-terminal domain-containing pilus assembly protein [Pseudomonas sp. PDM14]MBD9485374.1 pilus assembly protein PilX [Pseudomonas sp. PDM14]